MSNSEKGADRRFVFRGSAVPFAGRVHRIRDQRVSRAIHSPAASSLSVVGGVSHSTAVGSTFEDVFSWGESSAQSTGEIGEKGFPVTTVKATIADVRASNGPIHFKSDLLSVT